MSLAWKKIVWIVVAGSSLALVCTLVLRKREASIVQVEKSVEEGPVRPAGMAESVAAHGAVSFVALPPALPHSRPAALLGAEMFCDHRLPRTSRLSCAACHLLNEGGTDGRVRGGVLTRPVVNAVFSDIFLHDGSVTGLTQVIRLMYESADFAGGRGALEKRIALLQKDSELGRRFAATYPDGLTASNVVDSIVQYMHTRPLLSYGAPFDLFCGGRTNALDAVQMEGLELFRRECLSCHDGATLGARRIHEGKKVPALRGISNRRVFFGDGSCGNLEDAVMRMGGDALGVAEKTALVSFLRAL